ncbi:MAG: TonB-dependent receptor domain-containing protein [Vulcanimicrobiaceae bacterium]
MLSTFARRAHCGVVLFALCGPLAALAAETEGTISGSVTSLDGRPVAGARIAVDGPEHVLAVSGRDGRFSLTALPGTYSARVSAVRFTDPAVATIDVRADKTTSLAISLARSDSSLTTIGRVVTNGRETVSTSATPVTTINSQAYADQGFTRLSDVLQDDETTTLFHTAGGGGTVLPTSVAIRGPDPTETLVDIDGHQINNGNTGDFDLSLLDPADYASIELVRGISPSSLVGPDTIDGAINIRTLEPTVDPHGLLRLNFGSYYGFGSTLQSTGPLDGRLGYALSVHRQGTNGEVNENVFDQPSGTVQHVGSEMLGSSAIAKLRYAFGGSGAGYAELSFHDQSAFRDLSAGLTTYAGSGDGTSTAVPPAGLPVVDSYAGTALQTHNAGYGLDVSVPLGSPGSSGVAATTLLFRHYTSLVDESVVGPGAETTPYLFNSRDLLDDETLQLDHRIGNGALTLQYEIRNEALNTDFIPGVVNEQSVARLVPGAANALSLGRTVLDDLPAQSSTPGLETLPLGQTQRSLALRYTYNPTPALHFILGSYYSQLSLFGNYLDPRFGFVFTPDSRTALRASVGTTFQSPQLPELVVPNPLPVVVGNYISIGNPNLKPDQATEYGLGFDRIVQGGANSTALSADFYRVNLRQPAAPLNLPLDPNCGPSSAGGDGTPCPLSYPVNAGDGIYQGIELSARHSFGPFTTLRAGWAVRSAYLTAVPPEIQDGTLVVGEQSAGLPLHKATLTLTSAPPLGFTYSFNLIYESLYNELNQPQFATLGAHLGYRFPGVEVGLTATNLTNVYDQRFTTPGGGVIYGGLNQALPQDAYALGGTAFTFTLLRRF